MSIPDAVTPKKRVRILLRVSSNQQLDSDGDLSTQRQIILEHIAKHDDWLLDSKEYFEGGISGYRNAVSERDVLLEALRDARNKEYDILAVYKDDRLGRRTLEVPAYIVELKQAGVEIYTVKDGFISPKQSDAMDIVTLVLRYANAEKCSADTGMRVKDTAGQLVRKGKFMGGNAPYGYELVPSGEISKHGRLLKQPVIVPHQAEIVKYIYNLSLNKEYGSAKIARVLNAHETYKNHAPNDIWRIGTITGILTNPLYAGYTSYNRRENIGGKYIKQHYDKWIMSARPNPKLVIIDEVTWHKVQEKRALRKLKYAGKKGNKDTAVISRNDGSLSLIDVLYCGYCKSKMENGTKYSYWTIKNSGERRTRIIPAYRCRQAFQGVMHNKSVSYRGDIIEPVVYSSIADYLEGIQSRKALFNQVIAGNEALKSSMRTGLRAEYKKLDKIRHDIGIMEDRIPDALTGEYALSIDELKKQIDRQHQKEHTQLSVIARMEKELNDAFAATMNWEDVKNSIPSWHNMLLNTDNATRRVLINKLIERIELTRDTIVIRFKINPKLFCKNNE